ncbi:MAG: PD-(D/E)XK nuclease family protein [Candidatus Acidiferrales bacterium]
MKPEILPDLESVISSDELLALESILGQERNAARTNLQALENSLELTKLSGLFAQSSEPTIFEILEEFRRIDKNDEQLHSRSLEFFLNPREARHGLSDSFLAAVLKMAHFFRQQTPVDVLAGETDFRDTEVRREAVTEQGRADLRLANRRREFVLIIENKTVSAEGKRQLARYWQDAEREFPGFAIGGFFLTPEGRAPTTAAGYPYAPLRYAEFAELLQACAERRAPQPNMMLATQYASTIRRWFVEDPEKKKLAWRIFRKYPYAASYLSRDEVKPLWQVSEHLQSLVKRDHTGVEMVYSASKTKELEIWFVPHEWEQIPQLRRAGTAPADKQADDRLLIFWLECSSWESDHDHERQLNVYLGSVPSAKPEEVRKIMSALANGVPRSSPATKTDDKPQPKWTYLWGRTLLTEEQLTELDRDLVFKRITSAWQEFLDEDLPKITAAISGLFAG